MSPTEALVGFIKAECNLPYVGGTPIGNIREAIEQYERRPSAAPAKPIINEMPPRWSVKEPIDAFVLLNKLINHEGARSIIAAGTAASHRQPCPPVVIHAEAMLEQCKLFDGMLAQAFMVAYDPTTIATRRDQLRLLLDQIEPPQPPTYDELVALLVDAVSPNTPFDVHAARKLLARVPK